MAAMATEFVTTSSSAAFGIFLMRTAFLAMPVEIEEIVRLHSANPLQIF